MSEIIKLSRSTVEKYLSCPRCCVLDKKYQIKPPSLPFTLNIAVDNLCKNEFDYYRKIQEPHPLFIKSLSPIKIISRCCFNINNNKIAIFFLPNIIYSSTKIIIVFD